MMDIKGNINFDQRIHIDQNFAHQLNHEDDYMCDAHVNYFKQKLINWKNNLKSQLNNTFIHLQEENCKKPDITDMAKVEGDLSLELRKKDRISKLIHKINMALTRIERGIYGYCEDTGIPIGLRRLEARPVATLCIEAQEKHEIFEKNHNEECD